jgi:chromosome transmission fidelity protein 1
VRTLSCGHIVPKEHLLGIALPSGPSTRRFHLTAQARQDVNVIDELGRLLVNVCRVVPEGIIVFLPSFDYEQMVRNVPRMFPECSLKVP